jgi:transcriptional regulator GlxA family with amidase domain
MSVRHPTLVKAIEVMRRTFENPVSIASIAHETGHSRRQLERLFVNGLGKSPAVFYRELRLNRGRELLVTTDLAVTEIAIACGYSEVAHFARGFRARYGVVPTQLKRALRGRRDEPLPP